MAKSTAKSMAKRRVVVTGAAGYVAQRMWPELTERWDLVPIDVRPTTRDGKFWAEHTNVALAYNVCRVALEEGVRRVVVASSNHAADYYERLVWDGRLDMVTPEMPPRSDNWYGWAKAAYELLGFVFATGKVDGRALEIVQWRIGGPRD